MLSVANVRSAGGAANYFANDNYYTKADADRSGIWVGEGAERLGLSGTVASSPPPRRASSTSCRRVEKAITASRSIPLASKLPCFPNAPIR
ncbi:relaxase domain-containing protein [Erythrobacter sp. MTPC3]|uniref:relaxase domain-containing protein n=1 Tax=Erythrobacter sp. MTPC3 TaxID=3056564 RepID=UPI0036F36160